MAREMKDSGIAWIGDIPESWKIQRYKHIMHKEKSLCEHYNGEDIISLTMNGVIIRDLDAGGKMPTTFDGYQFVEPEDLLLCLFDIDVTPRCVGLVKNYGLTSPAYSRFKVHDGYYNAYYDYLLRMIDDRKIFVHLSKNLRSSLTESDFGVLPTIAPSYDEQKKIAAFLDAECSCIDSVIDQTRASIEEYKKLKQAVITQAVTKGIRPDRQMKDSGVDWIGKIPSDWDYTTIGRVSTVVRGGSPRPAGDPRYFNGSFMPWITVAEVTNSHGKYITSTATCLTEEGSKRSRVIEENTLLLSNSGATLGVPKITLIKGCINDGSVAFYDLLVDMNYLLYVFEGRTLELRKQMQGYGQPNLNTTIIKGLYVPLPSKDEQIEIASYLDSVCIDIEELILKKEQLLSSLESHKKSLIYEYVTGKKEVPA